MTENTQIYLYFAAAILSGVLVRVGLMPFWFTH